MMILKALFLLCLISITPSLASMSMIQLTEKEGEQTSSSSTAISPIVSPMQTPPALDPEKPDTHSALREWAKNQLSKIKFNDPLDPKLIDDDDDDSKIKKHRTFQHMTMATQQHFGDDNGDS